MPATDHPARADSSDELPASSGAELLSVGASSHSLVRVSGPTLPRHALADGGRPTRAGSWRRWLRTSDGERDFLHEVYTTMNGCLGCRTCASDCPLKRHVPELKPQFLELYHRRHPHSLKDYLVAKFEVVVPWLGRVPRLSNLVLRAGPFRWALRSLAGLVNPPSLSGYTLRRGLRQRGVQVFRAGTRSGEQAPGVLIVQDVFTTFFEPEVVLAYHDLLRELGYEANVLPFLPNGNALKVKGFAERFRRVARRNARMLGEAAALGWPLVGIDPAITLTYRGEFGDPDLPGCQVLLLQEWLANEEAGIRQRLELRGYRPPASRGYRLLIHCSERDRMASEDLWRRAFGIFGLQLGFFGSGCCRSSGTSPCQAPDSAETSWQKVLPEDPQLRRHCLATGYSCRRQVTALAGGQLRHPVEVLLAATRGQLG